MNTFAAVSTIMTRDLITVNPEDTLLKVQQLFKENNIHHIPVVRFRKMVGLISKTDLFQYMGGFSKHEEDRFIAANRLAHTVASDIMTTKLAIIEQDERINVAIEVFAVNRFHALPVVQDGDLVGIVTPFDILKVLRDEKPEHPEDVYGTKKV